jgi:hypothetical protein
LLFWRAATISFPAFACLGNLTPDGVAADATTYRLLHILPIWGLSLNWVFVSRLGILDLTRGDGRLADDST